jgi:hypothetical protein
MRLVAGCSKRVATFDRDIVREDKKASQFYEFTQESIRDI